MRYVNRQLTTGTDICDDICFPSEKPREDIQSRKNISIIKGDKTDFCCGQDQSTSFFSLLCVVG